MTTNITIRSRTNPIIKRVGAIQAGKEPTTLVLEGDRLVDDALDAGLSIEIALVAEARVDRAQELARKNVEVRLVDSAVLDALSRLKTPPGILALSPAPAPVELDDIERDADALVLVSAGLADPGNLGALARSAEALGARALVVTRGGASPWGEKALRGSMGSLLRLPVHYGHEAAAVAGALRATGWRQVLAATRGGTSLDAFDWKGPIALWVGAETGFDDSKVGEFECVTIPMRGSVESLNVAVAASLLLFASGRYKSGAAAHRARKDTDRNRSRGHRDGA